MEWLEEDARCTLGVYGVLKTYLTWSLVDILIDGRIDV